MSYALTVARTQSSALSTLYTYATYANRAFQNYLLPLVSSLSEKPDVASIILLLILLFVSLKLLNLVYNAVMFWVRLATRLFFWGTIIGVGLWIWQRGPDGVASDMESLFRAWRGEYEFWKAQADGRGATGTATGSTGRYTTAKGRKGQGRNGGGWF